MNAPKASKPPHSYPQHSHAQFSLADSPQYLHPPPPQFPYPAPPQSVYHAPNQSSFLAPSQFPYPASPCHTIQNEPRQRHLISESEAKSVRNNGGSWPCHVKMSFCNSIYVVIIGIISIVCAIVICFLEYPYGVVCFIFFFVGFLLLFVGLMELCMLSCNRHQAGWHMIVLYIGNTVVLFCFVLSLVCLCCGKGIDDYAYFSFCLSSDADYYMVNSSSFSSYSFSFSSSDQYYPKSPESYGEVLAETPIDDSQNGTLDTTYDRVPVFLVCSVVLFLTILPILIMSAISCILWMPFTCHFGILVLSFLFWSFAAMFAYGLMSLLDRKSVV